jgi:hypothetical protein
VISFFQHWDVIPFTLRFGYVIPFSLLFGVDPIISVLGVQSPLSSVWNVMPTISMFFLGMSIHDFLICKTLAFTSHSPCFLGMSFLISRFKFMGMRFIFLNLTSELLLIPYVFWA